jgi:hypothetical protein
VWKDWEINNKGYFDALDIRAAINAGDVSDLHAFCYLAFVENRLGPKDWEIYKEAFDQGWEAWEQKPLLRETVIEGYASDKEAQKRRAAFKVITRDDGRRS